MTDLQEPTVIDTAIDNADAGTPTETVPDAPQPPARTAVLTAEHLTEEEAAVLRDKLATARRRRESVIKYAEESLASARKALESVDDDTAPKVLRLLTAKRLLTAAGVEFSLHWDDSLVIRLGHVKAKEADAALKRLSRILGAFDADGKSIDVADRDGKKVLAIEMPSQRWPVSVKYTTPSSKKYACQIVVDKTARVVCMAVEG